MMSLGYGRHCDEIVTQAELLRERLREAGPGAPVWAPLEGGGTPFWARRMAHEAVVHRAGAALAAGAAFQLDRDVAVDALEEWMELDALPHHFERAPSRRELLGPGRVLHFAAADMPPEAGAEWLMDLTGDAVEWRRGGGEAAVRVRAPLTDLLLLLYRRYGPDRPGIEVSGDRALLDLRLAHAAFG